MEDKIKPRIKPLTDDGSNNYRAPCKPVEWIAYANDNPNKKVTVVAQTWYVARQKASAALGGVDPEQISIAQIETKTDQKPATTTCPSCSPIKSKSSKRASCK